MRLVMSAVLLILIVTSVARAQHTHVPTPSSWALSVAESNFGNGQGEKRSRLTILIDTDKWQKWSDTFIDRRGRTWHHAWSGPANGTLRPVAGGAGISYSVNATTDTSVKVGREGTTQICKFSLSVDKKKLTNICTVELKSGKGFGQTIVFNRTR